jgi:hypothetical protein
VRAAVTPRYCCVQTHSAVGGIAALIGGSSTLLDHLKDVLSHKFAQDPGETLCHTLTCTSYYNSDSSAAK